MEQSISLYKGMRNNIDPKVPTEGFYYRAFNKQLVNNFNSTTGAISDELGNKLVLNDIKYYTGTSRILKVVNLGDHLIAFVKVFSGSSYLKDVIFRFQILNGAITNKKILVKGVFNLGYNIDIVYKYKSPTLYKIYWADGINYLRHLNIYDESLNDITVPGSFLDMYPSTNITEPTVIDVVAGGRVPVGRVQYAYQFYNKDGAETIFSQLSSPVAIGSGEEYLLKSIGGDKDSISNKSVLVSIPLLGNTFNYVRVVCISYVDEISNPLVKVVYDGEINSNQSTFVIKDSGNYLGEIMPEFISTIGSKLIIPKTITSKGNYLVAGNIKEEYFDIDKDLGYYWDARAYRFLYNSNQTLIRTVNNTHTNYTFSQLNTIPQTHDCIQNRLDQTRVDKGGLGFMYKANSVTLGGSGINISYEFTVKQRIIDSNVTNNVTSFNISEADNAINNQNNAQTWNIGGIAGYMRDEIYRFGIVFIKNGRYSFVKWIADIKMPEWDEFAYPFTYSDNKLYSYILGLTFTVNNVPEGYSWQIVRAIRTVNDRTILYQGLLEPAAYFQGQINSNCRVVEPSLAYLKAIPQETFTKPELINNKLAFIHSPEISYKNTNINSSTYKYVFGDKLKYLGGFKLLTNLLAKKIDPVGDNAIENYTYITTSKSNEFNHSYLMGITPTNTILKEDFIYDSLILSSNKYGAVNNFNTNSSVRNEARAFYNNERRLVSYGGTSHVIAVNNSLDTSLPSSETSYSLGIVNYFRDSNNIYGGNSYYNKLNSTYIKAGKVNSNNLNTDTIFNGDTFIQMYEYLRLAFHPKKSFNYSTFSSTIYVPIETTINLEYTHGFLRNRYQAALELQNLQETNELGKALFPENGTSVDGVSKELKNLVYLNSYKDLYLYNTSYSRTSDLRLYYPKPSNFNEDILFPTKIVASEPDNLSVNDNWLKFLYTNSILLNGEKGEITKLIEYDNNLIAFQESAITVVDFQDKELIVPENSTALVVGSSNMLTRFDYLSEFIGAQSINNVLKSLGGLFVYDSLKKDLFLVSKQGIINLTNKFGIIDFKSISDTNSLLVSFGEDNVNSRIYLTVHNTTISYNYSEEFTCFESFHEYTPKIYFNFKEKLYSVNPGNNIDIYLHNEGAPLSYYGKTSNLISNLIVLINDKPYDKKVFTNIEFDTYSISDKNQIPIKTITVSTPHQTILSTTTEGSNLRRRFRTWRFTIPKGNNKERAQGYHCYITFTNNYNYTGGVILPTVLSSIKVFYLIPNI